MIVIFYDKKNFFKGGVTVNSTLQFLYGKNLQKKDIAVQKGRFYLDIETGELFYDNPDPTTASNIHNKIIDSATLIYTVSDVVSFPSSGLEDSPIPGGDGTDEGVTSMATATLGIARLGYMKLGQP